MKFENFEQHIVGNGVKEGRKETIKEIEKYWEKGRERREGELDKTPEELEAIETINEYLGKEFKEMNIGNASPISSEQIHLVPPEIFGRYMGDEDAYDGAYSSVQNASFCEKSNNRLKLYHTMLHESIHIVSAQKYYADTNKDGVSEYRTGYGVKNTIDQHEHFRGFNEAVVEKTTKDILLKYKEELIKKFNITEKEKLGLYFSYAGYRKILEAIIKKVSEYNNEDEMSVWERFKKGQFTGEMMHLRDIEKTYGEGSLRVLAALGSGTKDLPEEEINEKILQYFTTNDEKEKNDIAHEVLNERERLRYNQR